MSRPNIHIIGAGLAGLSAAVALASSHARIFVHEAAKTAGGRCRSYFDARLGMEIDNGNHLMLSGNANVLTYIKSIGAEDRISILPDARFDFVDLASGRRSTLSALGGVLPLWRLSSSRDGRRPKPGEYADLGKLLFSRSDKPLREAMRCDGPLHHELLRPLLLAALNTDPAEASSELVRRLLWRTLMKGEAACKPVLARDGLSGALIDPALRLLKAKNVEIGFARRLRALDMAQNHVRALAFESETISLSPDDLVILAVPAEVAAALAPTIPTPTTFNAILNAHFATTPNSALAPITAVSGATTEWLFAYPERLSVTVSAANHLTTADPKELAHVIWREVSAITGIESALPAWRIIKEKRATFAATPEQNRRRPQTRTDFSNLLLAGDWTATGLPATIEGAVQSGFAAAREARLSQMTQRSTSFDPSSRDGKTYAHEHYG